LFGPALPCRLREQAGYDVALITLAIVGLAASLLIASQARLALPCAGTFRTCPSP